MKHSQLAALALLAAGLLTGCSDTLQSPDEMKNEEYVQQFIRDFGIPAEGHDFSMAKTAGLQVKTSKSRQVLLTAEIDGTEYEFATLTVAPGVTPIPATIPNHVNRLNLYLGLDKYEVDADGIIDLDRLEASGESRGFTYNSNNHQFSINDDGNPVVAIRMGDFLTKYFEKFPPDGDNVLSKVQSGKSFVNGSSEFYSDLVPSLIFHETILCDGAHASAESSGVYDIFPIFWRETADGKDYTLRFSDSDNINNHTGPISFGTPGIPFAKLGYSTSVTDVTNVDFTNLEKDFKFDDGSFTQAYPDLTDENMVIVSEGIRVTIPTNKKFAGMAIDLITNGNLISSSSPYSNYKI